MPPEPSGSATPGLVSIIIPCHNAERFLRQTLDSVFTQTYPHTEIIVIDDGSTDATAEVIRSYADRVTAEFGPNRGASAARNRGTALARGEFIQYLDADDLLMPGGIAARIAALKQSGADVAYSDWERLVEVEPDVFFASERVVRRIEDIDPNVEIALITSFWAPPAALTYRRSLVEKIGDWKEWLPIIQDARFLQDAGLVGGHFIYAPGIGARYREHRGARLSRRGNALFASDVFRNACDLQRLFESRGGPSAQQRRALAQIYDSAARALLFHDGAAFRDCVARIRKVDPAFQSRWTKAASFASSVLGFKTAGMLLVAGDGLRRTIHKAFLS